MPEHIRPFTKEDWPAVAAIYTAGIATGVATFQTECPNWESWDAGHHPFCRLLCEREGQPAGWCALSPTSSRAVYRGVAEVSVYVAPEFRGQGVGLALLRELVARSEDAGIWTLQSGIIQENEASLRLHAACGFRVVGKREAIAKDADGVWRNTLLLERRSALR